MPPSSHRPPRIGLTLDAEPPGGYSQVCPGTRSARTTSRAIARAGGLPIALAARGRARRRLSRAARRPRRDRRRVRRRSGALRRGDAPCEVTHQGPAHRVRVRDHRRRRSQRDLPVLGICGGQQLLNVVLGGDLIQHIPDAVPDCLAHEQPNPRTEPGHAVEVVAGTLPASRSRRPRHARGQQRPSPGGRRGRPRRGGQRARAGWRDRGDRGRRRGASASASSGTRNIAISAADDALFDALVEACRRR